MNAVLIPTRMTPEEYLAWESAQPGKHEYINGEVFAMTGARLNHNRISLNAAVLLRQALRGGPCEVFVADLKVLVDASANYFYPDVVATCHPADLADGNALAVQHPWLIVEVLSESTAAYDRGDKFGHYRQLESLSHYLLIDSHRPHADLFVKNTEGLWVLHPCGAADTMMFDGVHCFAMPVAGLYEGVSFEPAAAP